jgi:hypothetical protein
MSEFIRVRRCGICSERNPVPVDTCRICGEDLHGVAAEMVARQTPALVWERLGAPERAILGCGLGVLIGIVLQPFAPFLAPASLTAAGFVASADDGLDQLMVPLTHQSFILILMCGVGVGAMAALTALAKRRSFREFMLAPNRRWPCPGCAELIPSQARICRFCDLPVERAHSAMAVGPRPNQQTAR